MTIHMTKDEKVSTTTTTTAVSPIKQTIDINIIIKLINSVHVNSGSSGNSHSNSVKLGGSCFDAIKIAWLGKVHRGENQEVDQFIDRCLGEHLN